MAEGKWNIWCWNVCLVLWFKRFWGLSIHVELRLSLKLRPPIQLAFGWQKNCSITDVLCLCLNNDWQNGLNQCKFWSPTVMETSSSSCEAEISNEEDKKKLKIKTDMYCYQNLALLLTNFVLVSYYKLFSNLADFYLLIRKLVLKYCSKGISRRYDHEHVRSRW